MRSSLLSLPLDILSSGDIEKELERLLTSDQFNFVVTLNSLLVLESQNSGDVRKAVLSAALVLADSVGIVWAQRVLNDQPIKRFPGIDVAWLSCELAARNKVPVYLLGGEPGVAQLAVKNLSDRIPGLMIGGFHHGYFTPEEEKQICIEIKQCGARLILVALGMPKQELFLLRNKQNFKGGVGIGIGGSFDVWAGRLSRAPDSFQKLGFEWFYRLWQQPFRWKRISQLPLFASRVLVQKIKQF